MGKLFGYCFVWDGFMDPWAEMLRLSWISVTSLFLIYRHEDGTVRFWDASGVALTPIYKLSTANVFHTDCDPCDDPPDPNDDPDMQQEEEWPPFRKASSEQEENMCIITFGYV